MAFGQHMARFQREKDPSSAAERAELARLDRQFEFEEFCRKQRARVSAQLKRSTDRIHAARWGLDHAGDGCHYVVSRKGSTEASSPVHHRYQEQHSK